MKYAYIDQFDIVPHKGEKTWRLCSDISSKTVFARGCIPYQ